MSSAPELKVVPIGGIDLNDIPACLRNLADKIERGELPAPRQAVLVSDDQEGSVKVFSWGDHVDAQQVVGLLTWGIHTVIHDT
ncbi:MAG: hypothetical protein KGI71_06630 [Patescibacteria group bacterium]|nr:hypothetical protein [Patescibacteria group bacterium]